MQLPNVFDAIDQRLENKMYPSKFELYYRLPRRVGTTTYLVNLANRLTSEGKKVLFVSDYFHKHHSFNSNVVLYNDNTIGYSFDIVIIDNSNKFISTLDNLSLLNSHTCILRIDSIDI